MYYSISNLRFLEAGVSVEQTTEPGSALAAPAVRSFLSDHSCFVWENKSSLCLILLCGWRFSSRSPYSRIFSCQGSFKNTKAISLHCNFNPGDSLPIQVQFSWLEEGNSRNGILPGWPLRKVRDKLSNSVEENQLRLTIQNNFR